MKDTFKDMTSYRIKVIALILMTVDHFAKLAGQTLLLTIFPFASLKSTYFIVQLMRGAGRIAFPLFAFMITEGCSKTHSMPRYIGRLSLFALISEPACYFFLKHRPGEVTFNDFLISILHFKLTNVFATLAIGAIAIYIWQMLCKHKKLAFLFIPALVLLLYLADYMGTDYHSNGVILIVALYFAKTKQLKAAAIIIWSVWKYLFNGSYTVFDLSYISFYDVIYFIGASFSSVIVYSYNGEQGKKSKWSFYIYYPVHILVLHIFREIL